MSFWNLWQRKIHVNSIGHAVIGTFIWQQIIIFSKESGKLILGHIMCFRQLSIHPAKNNSQ